MPWKFLLPALLAGLLFSETAQASFRCDGSIVKRGDRAFEVRQRCGEPDALVPLHTVYTVRYGHVPTREEWQYNFGPHRLMRFLVFQNGRLSQIRTGSHGFHGQPRQCRPIHIEPGMSQMELMARCGEPMARELRITQSSYRLDPKGRHYRRGLPAEDWIYDFGSNQFIRIVTLINGRVVNVERSSSRGGSS